MRWMDGHSVWCAPSFLYNLTFFSLFLIYSFIVSLNLNSTEMTAFVNGIYSPTNSSVTLTWDDRYGWREYLLTTTTHPPLILLNLFPPHIFSSRSSQGDQFSLSDNFLPVCACGISCQIPAQETCPNAQHCKG